VVVFERCGCELVGWNAGASSKGKVSHHRLLVGSGLYELGDDWDYPGLFPLELLAGGALTLLHK